MQIPVVDVNPIGLSAPDPNTSDFLRIGREIHDAFVHCGFVYLRHHGIGSGLIDDAFEASRTYFGLPQEVKERIPRDPDVQQGYVAPGREIFDQKDGTKAPFENRESFDVTFIDSDASFPDDLVPAFRPRITALAEAAKELTYRILCSLSLSLDLPKDFFTARHKRIFKGKNISKLRPLYYPALDNIRPGEIRCGEHSDYGTITLLFQDKMGGLEVKGVDGKWVEATPIDGTVLVNVGDLLEIWTGGLFPATRHRVVIPEEEVRRRQPRQSIVMFVHPEHETIVKPLRGGEDKEERTALEIVTERFKATFEY